MSIFSTKIYVYFFYKNICLFFVQKGRMNDERGINPKLDVHPADTTGSYALAFISGGIIAGCGALCYWFIVQKPIEVN